MDLGDRDVQYDRIVDKYHLALYTTPDFFTPPLSEKDGEVFDLSFMRPPCYACQGELFDSESFDGGLKVAGYPLNTVPGVIILPAMLEPGECKRIISACETIGFRSSCGIGDATKDGTPPSKCTLAIPPPVSEQWFDRIKDSLPSILDDGRCLLGINPRLRLYKYREGHVLGPHFDRGDYTASAVDSQGELRFDYYADNRRSAMSLLIYLNHEGVTGGETVFFPEGVHAKHSVSISPCQGDGVAFFHGGSILSPLHEGSLVRSGIKYIIRTDVMYSSVKPDQ